MNSFPGSRRPRWPLLAFPAGRRLAVGLLPLLLLACWFSNATGTYAQPTVEETPTVIVLVRHAEPVYPPPTDAPRDPPLNVMGQERAEALARLVSTLGIERVYSTDYRRTRETAAPTATMLDVDVRSYDPADLPAFAARLLSTPGRFLVVGHSNTTPRLVELLGGSPGEPIDEGREFDRLYVLSGSAMDGLRTITLRYGESLPDNWRDLAALRRPEPTGGAVSADPAIRERRYCTQFGPFLLRFDRDEVAGIYAIVSNGNLGTIVGSRVDGVVEARWFEVNSAGDIEIRSTNAWTGFVARYRTDDEPEKWYEGWRGVEQPPGGPARIDDPAGTLLCERPVDAP